MTLKLSPQNVALVRSIPALRDEPDPFGVMSALGQNLDQLLDAARREGQDQAKVADGQILDQCHVWEEAAALSDLHFWDDLQSQLRRHGWCLKRLQIDVALRVIQPNASLLPRPRRLGVWLSLLICFALIGLVGLSFYILENGAFCHVTR